MMLPYDPALSYWMRALPQFEWQPEPPDPNQSSTPEATPGSCVDPTVSGDPAVCTGSADDAPHGPPLPRLRLVMTGVRWVAVPYWTPRENPHWESMAQDGREEDRRRTDATTLQAQRSSGATDSASNPSNPSKACESSASGADDVPPGGKP